VVGCGLETVGVSVLNVGENEAQRGEQAKDKPKKEHGNENGIL